jgi:hypothetical protein
MSKNVIGVFRTRDGVNNAVNALLAAGFAQAEISVLMTDNSRGEHFAIEEKTRAAEGAATGGVTGGVLGAIVAGLTAVAALSIPGLGILASGPIIAALAGGGAGAAAGGLIGGLVGLGIKEHEAKLFEDEVRRGGMLVGVHVSDHDRAEVARRVFRDTGALNYA